MTSRLLVAYMIFMLALSCGYEDDSAESSIKNDSASTTPSPTTSNADDRSDQPGDIAVSDTGSILTKLEVDILALTNMHREARGLKPLVANKILQEQAKEHSSNMADGSVPFGHQGFEGRGENIRRLLKTAGIAENVAYRQDSAESVVESWLSSHGHRQNIEGDYRAIGIGAVQSAKGYWYYTQIFSR